MNDSLPSVAATPPRPLPRPDALALWRGKLALRLGGLRAHLDEAGLLGAEQQAACDSLLGRLASDPLMLVCVAEFAAGKSELLNALLFADAGCRVLPVAPGATTLCPLELGWEARKPAQLALLPIDTLGKPLTLAQWRERPDAWHTVPLDAQQPAAMAEALRAVTRTRLVTRDQARAWGLTGADEHNGPSHARGRVPVPAWRHALVNLPHPLLASGLVLVDTPGLGALGGEPGATLALLPMATAVCFVIDASRGVSRNDLALWQAQLDDPALSRFVVLSKTDLLADPLAAAHAPPIAVRAASDEVAQQLGVPVSQVFAVSAREALLAAMAPATAESASRLAASGVPALKAALIEQLLPQRQRLLELAVASFTQSLQGQLTRRVRELRRAHAQQMLELRALEAKTTGRADQIEERLVREQAAFDQFTAALQGLRAAHTTALDEALAPLGDALWREVDAQLAAMLAGPWYLPRSAAAFAQLCETLKQRVDALETALQRLSEELLQRLAEPVLAQEGVGALATPDLARLRADLAQIQHGYARYFGVRQMARMTVPQFVEQFRRMLTSRMRSVFDHTIHQVRLWSRAALEPLEVSLAHRETYLGRRRETLVRADSARGDLLRSLTELVRQDEALLAHAEEGQHLAAALRAAAQSGPAPIAEAANDAQDAAA